MSKRSKPRLLGIAISLALVLAACGDGAEDDTATTTPSTDPTGTTQADIPATTEQSAETVELRFLAGFTGGDRPVYEQLIQQFNEEHPGINVTLDIQPWDAIAQTLPAALAAGEGPDLATPSFQEGSVFEYAMNEAILPLDDLYGTEGGQIDPDVMPPAIFDAFALEGVMYAAPANFATLMLYHNNEVVSEAPATTDEFRSMAAEATTDDVYGLLLAENQTIPMWPILTWADGGDFVGDDGCSLLDDPATIAAIEPWAELVVSEGISPVGETGAGTDNLFAAGQGAMQMNGPWAAPGYTDAGIDFGLAPVPEGSAGSVTLASSVPIVVNADTPNKDAAYTFLAWWTGAEAQKTLALGSGFPPARTDLAEDPDITADPVVANFAAQVPNARIFLSGVVPFAEIAGDIWEPAIAQFTRGEPVADVLTEAAEQMDAVLGCS